MKFKEFQTQVLQLINQYTLSGERIEPTYNGQADYLVRIPALLDSAQTYIATSTWPICETYLLDWDSAEQKEGFYIFQLPCDMLRLPGDCITMLKDGQLVRYHGYHIMGNKRLAIPKRDKAHMELTYHRYPRPVPPTPDEYFGLDNTPEAQDAATYFVAAQLVINDDPYLYQSLYNEFESRRLQMSNRPRAEYEMIEDRFGYSDLGVYLA